MALQANVRVTMTMDATIALLLLYEHASLEPGFGRLLLMKSSQMPLQLQRPRASLAVHKYTRTKDGLATGYSELIWILAVFMPWGVYGWGGVIGLYNKVPGRHHLPCKALVLPGAAQPKPEPLGAAVATSGTCR